MFLGKFEVKDVGSWFSYSDVICLFVFWRGRFLVFDILIRVLSFEILVVGRDKKGSGILVL